MNCRHTKRSSRLLTLAATAALFACHWVSIGLAADSGGSDSTVTSPTVSIIQNESGATPADCQGLVSGNDPWSDTAIWSDTAVWSDTVLLHTIALASDAAVWSSSILSCTLALGFDTAIWSDTAVWSDTLDLNDAAVWSHDTTSSASATTGD